MRAEPLHRLLLWATLAAAIGSETTYSGGIGPSGQSDGLSFGRFNEEFAMSRIRV